MCWKFRTTLTFDERLLFCFKSFLYRFSSSRSLVWFLLDIGFFLSYFIWTLILIGFWLIARFSIGSQMYAQIYTRPQISHSSMIILFLPDSFADCIFTSFTKLRRAQGFILKKNAFRMFALKQCTALRFQ